MPAARRQLELDYAASFTANTSAATVAMTALAVTTTATWLRIPWYVIAVCGAALVACAVLVWATRKAMDKPLTTTNATTTRVHRPYVKPYAVTGALALSWAAWTAETSLAVVSNPYTWPLTHYWAAFAVFLTTWALTWWAMDTADIRDEAHFAENLTSNGTIPEETQARIDAEIEKGPRWDLAQHWAKAVKFTMGFLPDVAGLSYWDPVNGTSPGFTLILNLPKGASAQNFTASTVAQLASDAQLPNGCTITTARGERQGQILLNIETIDPSTITHRFPRDYSPLSILNMIPWGASPHGAPIGPVLRQKGAIIVGPPGTGKTMLLNTILAQLSRCPDVLVWGIDVGKQGAAFRHWTTDLPAGTRPIVDAVARNDAEALAMIQAAQRGADLRVHHYAPAMKAANTDLVPIGPNIPQIVLIFDESAELFNYENNDPTTRKVREAAIKLMRTTRQAGIRTILTFTDGNVISVGSTDILKYNPIKVALCGGGADPDSTSVAKLFGQVRGIDSKQIEAPGAGVANYGKGPEIHRGMLSEPDMIEECVIQTSQYRATLDEPTLGALGSWYTNRVTAPTDDTTDSNTIGQAPTHKPVVWTATDSTNLTTDMAEFEAQFADHADNDGDPLGWLQKAAAEVQANHATTTPAPAEPAAPAYDGWRAVVLDHLATNPETSYSTSDLVWILANQYGTTLARQTLATQLTRWAEDDTVTVIGTGAHRTYTHRQDPDA